MTVLERYEEDMSYGELLAWLTTMERHMATVVSLDASPSTVLRSMRGPMIDARRAYPGILQVQVRDSGGGIWRLSTQDAEWSPFDPTKLLGLSIDDAEIDEESGELRCRLPDRSVLDIKPAQPRQTMIRLTGS